VECQLIIDYKGLVELAMRSGNVAAIHADTVRESDVFEYNRGTIETHKIDFRKPRGEVFAVYALVRFKDGAEKAEVMTREDVEKVRLRSRAGQSGPWMTDWEEMAKKTVFRRLSKWIPLSAEFRAANEHDADALPELISGARLEAPRPLRPAGAPEPEPEPEPAVELTAADCVSFIADAESSRKADLRRALMRSGLKSGDDWREAPAGVLAAIVADLKGGSDAND
jgi:recombination protein RecT